MSVTVAREQFLREPRHGQVAHIAAQFEQLAACVTQRRDEAQIMDVLAQTRDCCAWALSSDASDEAGSLLSNLQTAVRTWQQVWPRLGATPDFRQAVAREANLWSRRLTTLAKQT
jgi:hypothetical protein